MHSKDISIRGTKHLFEEYNGKIVLIVGAQWSGQDIMNKFLAETDCNVIISGNVTNLHSSLDFKEDLDSGKLVLKEGKNLAFDASSVTFEDASTINPDLVIFSTGYRFSFPFLDDDIIEYSRSDREIGPLYL